MTDRYIVVSRYKDAYTNAWRKRWPNLTPSELKTSDGALVASTEMLDKLQALRNAYGKPLKINSAYRSVAHNRAVGGGKNSQHMKGKAIDIHITSIRMGKKLEELAKKAGFTAIGRYNGVNTRGRFIHLDTRPAKASGALYIWGSWTIRNKKPVQRGKGE